MAENCYLLSVSENSSLLPLLYFLNVSPYPMNLASCSVI